MKTKRGFSLLQMIGCIMILAILALIVIPCSVQALTVTQTSGTLTTSGATITGTNTCDVTVNGITNSVYVRVFYGGSDGSTNPVSWANSSQSASSYTNGQSYSLSVSGLSPGTVIYYRTRAQDLSGTAWASASGTFTTSSATGRTPDSGFREGIRLGTNTWGTAVIGGTNYTVGIVSVLGLDGSTNTVPKLTAQ